MGNDAGPDIGASTPAAALRRPGRPQRLPFDATPSHLPQIDATKRVAWLLATTRLLAPTTAHVGRSVFVERLRSGGLTLDTTRLSRWESGATPVGLAVVSAYEVQTQVPTGTLVAASLMVRRHSEAASVLAAGATERRARTATELPSLQGADELDHLFDLVDAGRATGGDWLALATEVNRFDRVYLHPGSWSHLCSQLVSELARSGGGAFLRRYEAAALLMRHPAGRRHLGRSLGAFVMHPHVQNAAPALALLSEVGDTAAGELVVRLLSDSNPVVRRGAMGVAAAMAARGQLPANSEGALESVAAHDLHKGNPSRRAAAYELASQLPAASFDRLMAATPDERTRLQVGLVRSTLEMVSPEVARSLADRVAARAEQAMGRSAQDPDQMLRKLVREGLFHALRDRRHLAAALLAASQYASAISEAVLPLTRERDDVVASMAWSMLRRLSATLQRTTVELHIPERRAPLQVRAMVTLGLARGGLSDDGADRLLHAATTPASSRTIRHAATFALGMSGHPHLRALSRHPESRDAGAWWLEIGEALHDPPFPQAPV